MIKTNMGRKVLFYNKLDYSTINQSNDIPVKVVEYDKI